MIRERLARYALLGYPSDARAAHGEEMLTTLLDASAGSRIRFVRELADLVRLGVSDRARRAAGAGPRRLAADGICLGAVWLMTLDLSTLLAQRARGMRDPLLSAPSIALLAAVLAIALVGFDRLAGTGALMWTALRLPALAAHRPGFAGAAPELVAVACFATMALAPRRRARDPRRLAWLLVPAGLVGTLGPPRGEQDPLLMAGVLVASAAVAVYGLALLSTDPRVAIAGAIALTDLGVAGVVVNRNASLLPSLFVAAAPAVLAFALRRSADPPSSARCSPRRRSRRP